jgi:RNA polymerase sigma-70 factor (ECF subfamily)
VEVIPMTRQQRFEALAGDVAEPVLRFALRRTTDRQTAEDVLSETLLVAWRRLEDIPAGAELPWCYSVARKQLANAVRSERRRNNLVARIIRLDPPAITAPAADGGDPAVHGALAQLPAEQQELLRLSAWEGLTPADIAVVLGISANAVHIRLHRARRRLGDVLAAQNGKDGWDGGQRQSGRGGRHA